MVRNREMKVSRVSKLFNGYASVRSPVVDNCVKTNSDLLIVYDGKSMLLKPLDLLNKRKQFVTKQFTSHWRGTYQLYDYKFNPNGA